MDELGKRGESVVLEKSMKNIKIENRRTTSRLEGADCRQSQIPHGIPSRDDVQHVASPISR